MNNTRKTPAIVVFAVLTVITTVIWVGFEVYRTLTKEPSPSVPDEIIAELDPNLDTGALADINQSIYLDESEIGETELIDINNFQINTDQEPEQNIASDEGTLDDSGEDVNEATDESELNQ